LPSTDSAEQFVRGGFGLAPGAEYTVSPGDADSLGGGHSYFGLGAAVSEVQVDVLTGEVNVIRSDLLYDAGQSLNPLIDIGQAEGAFVMGLGHYLMEETLYGKDNGILHSDGTWEYKPPLASSIPETFNVEFLKDTNYAKVRYECRLADRADVAMLKHSHTSFVPLPSPLSPLRR
jgi:xanthine dehydrogenase molybdopterin-binding subunit B